MSPENFIALHFPSGQENIAGTLHLNVNQVGTTSQGRIDGLIVHVDAFSINGNTIDTNIENVLEQIEMVSFTFLGIEYQLTIETVTYYPAQNPFFYYTVLPAFVPDIFNAQQFIASIENVSFTPFLLDVQFGFSEFNPLISNASENRDSYRIMQSDRTNQTINPSNIDALLNLTADKAQVQDSLYSDSGWTNARYDGTETTAAKSAGIPPTLAGRSFTGEIFPSGSESTYICSLTSRLDQKLFHTGDSELPLFELDDQITIELRTDFGRFQTQLNYVTFPSSGSIDTGDVLKVTSGAHQFEYVKVKTVNTPGKNLIVERDIYGHYISSNFYPNPYTTGTEWTKVKRFDIFRFDDTGQNRIQLANNSRVYINGNNTIIETDDYGQITSASICPPPSYLVD